MARGSRIVNEYGIVQDVDDLFIAYSGRSMQVASGFVAQAGIVRQFWPKTTINQTGIVLEPGTYDSFWRTDGSDARAICYYIAQTGQLVLSEPDGVEGQFEVIDCINPAPRSTGHYLFKLDIISGDIEGNDATGVWIDVNSEGTVGQKEYWVEQSGSGASTGEALVSFAENDGAGNPVAGTTVSATITFRAEVGSNRICMSTLPWTLDNTEVNELAEAWILTVPEGWWDPVNEIYVEQALINGEFGFPKGVQESEVYACTWSPAVTVQIDQVSGDTVWSPEGWQLGVPYTTDVRRRWKIESATPGDIKNAVVDVTVSDGSETVVKRVTMRTEQKVEEPDVGSGISDEFTRMDKIHDEDLSGEVGQQNPNPAVEIDLTVRPDGTINVTTLNGGQQSGFPQDWHLQAPNPSDPQNYECKIFVRQQDSLWPNTAYSTDFWFSNWQNLSSTIRYKSHSSHSTSTAGTVTKTGTWTLGIREVGRPETVKYKKLKVSTQTKVS